MREALSTITLAVILGSTSCVSIKNNKPKVIHFQLDRRDYNRRVHQAGYTFVPTNVDQIKKQNFLPPLHPSYKKINLILRDSKGKEVNYRDFIRRGVREKAARAYVNKGLESILKDHEKNKVGKEDLALATSVLNYFWRDLSKDAGKCRYSGKYEAIQKSTFRSIVLPEYMRFTITYEAPGDSVQTLGEFRANSRKCEGDCDDFAMGLFLSYEIAKDISSKRSGKFWKRLNDELQRFQVLFIVERYKKKLTNKWVYHALNSFIVYNKDFSKGELHPVEPQEYSGDYIERNAIKNNGKELIHIKKITGMRPEIAQIRYFFNSTAAYEIKS